MYFILFFIIWKDFFPKAIKHFSISHSIFRFKPKFSFPPSNNRLSRQPNQFPPVRKQSAPQQNHISPHRKPLSFTRNLPPPQRKQFPSKRKTFQFTRKEFSSQRKTFPSTRKPFSFTRKPFPSQRKSFPPQVSRRSDKQKAAYSPINTRLPLILLSFIAPELADAQTADFIFRVGAVRFPNRFGSRQI